MSRRQNTVTLDPRAGEYLELKRQGYSLREIGKIVGITGERVRQILLAHGVDSREETWGSVADIREVEIKAKPKQDKRQCTELTYGCSYEDAVLLNEGRPLNIVGSKSYKYQLHKRNATQRGVGFCISFPEWVGVWGDNLKFAGVKRGELVMCRKGDSGPYAVDNVFIATCSENISDAFKFRGGKRSLK